MRKSEKEDIRDLIFTAIVCIGIIIRAFVIGEHIIRDVLLAVLLMNFNLIVTGRGLYKAYERLHDWNILRKKDKSILNRLRYVDYIFSKETVKEKDYILNQFPYLKESSFFVYNWGKKCFVRGEKHKNDFNCIFTSKKVTFKCKLGKKVKRRLGSKFKIRKTQRMFIRKMKIDMCSFNSVNEYIKRVSFEFEKYTFEIDNEINQIIKKK